MVTHYTNHGLGGDLTCIPRCVPSTQTGIWHTKGVCSIMKGGGQTESRTPVPP